MEKKIYFDESFPQYVVETIAKLAAQLPSMKAKIVSTREVLGKNCSDLELIKQLAAENSWLVMRETTAQRTRLEAKLLSQYGVSLFFVQLSKGQEQVWRSNKVLSSNLPEMLQIVNDPTATTAYRIKQKGRMEAIDIF
jgi:6-phosphofructokinase